MIFIFLSMQHSESLIFNQIQQPKIPTKRMTMNMRIAMTPMTMMITMMMSMMMMIMMVMVMVMMMVQRSAFRVPDAAKS